MIKVKDLKEAIKELKENGRKYYRVSIYNGIG